MTKPLPHPYKYMTHRVWGGIFTINTDTHRIDQVHREPEQWAFMKSIGWDVGVIADQGDGNDLSIHWKEITHNECKHCVDVPDDYEGCFCIESAT